MPKTNYLRGTDEETLNALTHSVGIGLFLAGAIALGAKTYEANFEAFVACILYCACQIFTYTCSAIYHSRRDPVAKRNWRLIDHLSIYLTISGSWTPIFVLGMDFWTGMVFTTFMWGICCWGIIYKIRNIGKNELLSTVLYLVMGWSGVLAFLASNSPQMQDSFYWIFLGGAIYTAGTFFYYRDFNRYFHTIWHIFTIVASLVHFYAIWRFFT